MGLFINDDRYPNVYKSNDPMIGPNQVVYRTDLLSEWMSEQRKLQASLNNRFTDFEQSTRRQNTKYMTQGKIIAHRFEELNKNNERHARFEVDVRTAIKNLTTKNHTIQKLLTNGRSLDLELLAQLNKMNESSKGIATQLSNYEEMNAHISKQMVAQDHYHEKLEKQILHLETTQTVLLSRLDSQEGLMEKLLRQVDHIRSIIFERSHFIVGKIEKVNKLTSSYRAKRKTGSGRSIKLHKIDEEQKSK